MAEKLEIQIIGEDKASSVFKNFGKIFLSGGIFGLGMKAAEEGFRFLKDQIGSVISEGMEAQDLQSQLGAVLESTGGKAGVTADAANELASSLSLVTRFSDDTILSGENMLLTFTNIGKDIFPQATETMLNMSQALGQDLKSSSIQLGKALNDPITGVTALRRVGVSFTESQTEMIKKLVESGDVLGAQKLILGELETEFGNSARAAGTTFAGQLDILNNAVSEVKESVGTALIPIFSQLISDYLLPAIPTIQKLAQVFIDVVTTLTSGGGLADVLNVLKTGLTGLVPPEVITAIDAVGNAILQITATIQTFVTTVLIPFVTDHAEAFKGALIAIGAVLAAGTILAGITSLIGVLTAILSPIGLIIIAAGLLGAAWAEDWGGIQEKTAAVWAVIQPLFETIKIWLQINIPIGLEGLRAFWVNVAWPAIQNAVQTAWPIILALFTALVNFISNTIVPITMDFWRRWTTEWWPAIQKTVQTVWPVIQGIFQALITFITGTIVPTVATLQSNWSTSWTAIQTALQNVWRIIEGVFTELGRWINDNIIPWVKYLYEQWTGVWWPQIQSAIEDMWKVIQPIFDAIRAWMEEKLPPALDKIQAAFSTGMTAIQNAIDPVKKAWDGIVSAVQGFWTWITSHTFKFTISLPDLPSWARPPGTGKAGGGSVWPGQVYRVGEHGEEWFVPNVPGQIISNSVLRSFTAALNKSGGTASGMTTSLGTQKVQSTVNQYYLTANYAYQNEASLASDIRTLEMMHRSSL